MTEMTRMTQNPATQGRRRDVTSASAHSGPMRTLKPGDRITVCGDLELVSVEGQEVQVRVRPTSTPIMFPVKAQLNARTT